MVELLEEVGVHSSRGSSGFQLEEQRGDLCVEEVRSEGERLFVHPGLML